MSTRPFPVTGGTLPRWACTIFDGAQVAVEAGRLRGTSRAYSTHESQRARSRPSTQEWDCASAGASSARFSRMPPIRRDAGRCRRPPSRVRRRIDSHMEHFGGHSEYRQFSCTCRSAPGWGSAAGRRPSCGTWTAPWSTPSRTGSRPSSRSSRSTAAPGAHEHALNLVGNDLLESGRYIREHSGHRPRAGARSSRSCSTGWSRGSSARCRGGPGAVELLADLRRPRRAAARW